ncbi:ABC transporter permease [Microbacterium rhizophilus]|uniref:ABC transporter permease n=1 Tax=Microbacterium rhizophilus TaxID=3138934 RepID=UPI0031E8D6BD
MSLLLTLLRQRARRDWLQLLLWIGGLGLLAVVSVGALDTTYGDETERKDILTIAVASRTVLVFRGTPNGADAPAFAFFQLFTWLAVMAGLMASFLAVRHTRAEEEAGRAELVGATPAGRVLPTIATVVHGLLAVIGLGFALALALAAGGLPLEGSLVFGAAVAAAGAAFLGFGLFAAQLFRTGRGANGIGVAFVLGSYLMRGVGDAAGTPSDDLLHVTPAWPTYLSPIGWGQLTGAYVDDDLLPLLVPLVFAAVCVIAVILLLSVRDMGASLLPGAKGRATAGPILSSSFGLAWRLNQSTLWSWTIGAVATGLLATSLTGLVDQLAGEAPAVMDTLRAAIGEDATLEQAFVGTFFSLIGILAACCAVQVGIRARQEEVHGTAEAVLATRVPRLRWILEYAIVGVAVIVVVLAAAGAAGSLGALTSDSPGGLLALVWEAAAAQLPVSLVFLGLTLVVFAVIPHATIPLAWTVVGVSAMIGFFGPLFGLPEGVVDLSPFAHSPLPTGDETDWTGGLWLLGIGVILTVFGVVAADRRELTTG